MMSVNGATGARKSFIINTIVSYLRRMFDNIDTVHVLAPTVMSDFNILGETLHRRVGMDYCNMKKEMKMHELERIKTYQ
jgi:hypothetical protein